MPGLSSDRRFVPPRIPVRWNLIMHWIIDFCDLFYVPRIQVIAACFTRLPPR
jgi:hypothetical protein